MSLSLRAMRYVQAAMKHNNISLAAEEMHVAPSAIATALNQAEEAFGFALVTRARAKGIFPTSAGRDVLRRIEDLLERYDYFMADVSNLQSGFTGTLRIGYNAPIAPAFLSDIAAEMVSSYPDLNLSFFESDNDAVQQALLDGQVDVILFVSELPNPQIDTLPLIFAPTYCLCSAEHPFSKRTYVSIKELSKEPLILIDRPAAHGYYMDLLRQGDKEPNIVATTNSTEMARSLVASSVGISLLNMKPRETGAYAGAGVKCIPIQGSKSGVTFSLGTSAGPKRELTQAFLKVCEAYFKTDIAQSLIVPQET